MTTTDPQPTIGWHPHRWTPWGEPFATEDKEGRQCEDQQERRCVRCGRRQRRDVGR